jgi:pimeloyl-ACP methyl ester carboxylesterase
VYAPALPGFGGTADLLPESMTFAGYAEWLDRWLAALPVDQPVALVGHSFGGGVAIATAHDHPRRVSSLVLVDAIGHPTGRRLWEYAVRIPIDLMPMASPPRMLPSVLEDALPNLVRNPMALWRVARLVRSCDLTPELTELRRRRLPVAAIWGAGDRVVPRATFDGLCASLGSPGSVVAGNHCWPIADPDAFAEAAATALQAGERAARRLRRPA